MTNPSEVNHPRFPVSDEEIIYNDGEFSIAISIWDGSDYSVGVRWNTSQGGGGSGIGFPNSRGRASWLILPRDVGVAMLHGLKEMMPQKIDRIETALNDLN